MNYYIIKLGGKQMCLNEIMTDAIFRGVALLSLAYRIPYKNDFIKIIAKVKCQTK